MYDSGLNLSDHILIIFKFRWSLSHRANLPTASKKVKQYSWRWDKSDLVYYYQCTYNNLNALKVPNGCGCGVKCSCSSHDIINSYYENIVAALHDAARTSIKRMPHHSLKPFWNEELDKLKHDSIFWHNLWTEAGRPSSGVLQSIRLSCKARYKLGLRNAYSQFENSLSDEMCHHFMNKRIPEFWKTWNANFKKNISKKININGHINDVDVANEFAAHFKRVFSSSGDDVAYSEFVRKRADYISDDAQSSFECIDKVTVELIDKCVKDLKTGKACGPDDLGAEHLLYAHPALIVHLQNLFKLILCHRFVPNSFGFGVTIPLVKDKTGNINDANNYRGITLSPIISKLFEVVLLSMCNDVLKTDSLLMQYLH